MIRSHFGLQRNPFDPEAVTLLAHQQEIFDILRVHAQQGGLCLVLGEPGTGKSVLKQALLQHDPKRMITPVVNRTLHTYHNTLRILCEAFQIEFEGRDHHCERLLVQQAFSVHRAGKMLVPIIDDAHLMPPDSLRKLRLLCEDFPRSHCLALIGQPPLLQSLSLSINEEIRSRVTYSALLSRLAPETVEHIPTDKGMLRKWLKAGFMENRILFPTEAGTPQGGIISPTLANLTLDGLELLLKGKLPSWREPNPKVNLIRYADDFIITGTTKELLENEVKPLVEQFLRDRGLQLSPEKTCITHIENGFDFLGQNLRKFNGKLLIRPSKKNTHVFLEKVRQCIRNHNGASQTDLIRHLNPVIRGWANYHRHIVAMETFKKVEWVLRNSLWRWAKRRHPEKSARWTFQRYWRPLGGKRVFAADTGKRTPSGQPLWLKLVNPTQISIRRHVKIRAEANPFAPDWRDYFEDRAFFKKFGIHRREAGLKPSSEPAPQ